LNKGLIPASRLAQINRGDLPPSLHDHYSRFTTRFVLLHVQHQEESGEATKLRNAVGPWGDLIRVVELAPSRNEADRARFDAAFGRSGGFFMVRPDSYVGFAGDYVGFAGDERAAGRHLDAYCRRWLTATEPAQAA